MTFKQNLNFPIKIEIEAYNTNNIKHKDKGVFCIFIEENSVFIILGLINKL